MIRRAMERDKEKEAMKSREVGRRERGSNKRVYNKEKADET